MTLVSAPDSIPHCPPWLMGLVMTTFLANTLTEAAKTDDNRFEMTFVDAARQAIYGEHPLGHRR